VSECKIGSLESFAKSFYLRQVSVSHDFWREVNLEAPEIKNRWAAVQSNWSDLYNLGLGCTQLEPPNLLLSDPKKEGATKYVRVVRMPD
jgi:hypothetical protein